LEVVRGHHRRPCIILLLLLLLLLLLIDLSKMLNFLALLIQ